MKVGVLEIEMMANMARLSKDLKRANSEITSAVRGFNNVLNTIGVGISFAFFADLARRSNEFEKSLAKISTQIDDTSGQIDKLANSSRNFASQYGTSQVEQANAFYEIISAGIEDTTKATEILNTANKLAIGGITTLGVSVDGLTNIMNSYAGKVESADAVSDALFIGMKAGKATMEELSSGLGKVTPLAATLNVSFDELVAVLATLSKQGIQTSEAITGVRAILSAVAKPTTQAAKTAEELGLQFNAASLQAKGFAGFIEDVISKTDGSTTALSTLFGRVEALVPVLSLAGTGGEDFNNILEQMGDKAGATQEAFEKMAASPGFKVDQLMSSISNAAISLGAVLSDLLTPAIVAATNAFNGLFLTEEKTPVQKQIELITSLEKQLASELDKKNIPFGETFLFSKRDADLLAQRLDDAMADLVLLQKTAEDTGTATGGLKEDIENLAGDTGGTSGVSSLGSKVDKTKQKIDSFVESIKRQAAEAGKTANEIKRMEAAQLGVLHVVEPYLTVIEKQAIAEEDLRKSREKQADDLRKIEQITTSMRTKQEIYNDTVKELDDLLTKGLGVDVYNRALQKAQEELNNTDKTARDAFSNTEQYAIQAARNIQSIFANAITSIFTGFQGLGDSIKNVLVSTLSQVASSNVLRGLGIGVAGGAAANGGGLSDLFSTGFGLTNAVSAIGGGLPGSIGAFFSGFGGGTVAGVSSPAALAGSSFASFAGPAAIAGVADIALRQIFGDKKLGGTAGDILSYVPVVGTLINGLFGRGAPKFQNESLVGSVSAGGFEGVLNQAYKEKGGLLKGSRVSNFIADTDTGNLLNQFGRLSESGNIPSSLRDSVSDPAIKRALEVGQLLDDTFISLGKTMENTAKILGISSDGLKNFNAELDLVSEKGETLSEAQISDAIADISNQMVSALIPSIDELSRSGETATDTLVRIGAEFQALENALIVSGAGIQEARDQIQALTLEQRTAITDQFGGADVLQSEVQNFFSNILNESQQLEIVEKRAKAVSESLGLDFIPTLDQLYEGYRNGSLATKALIFENDDLVKTYYQLTDAVNQANEAAKKEIEEKEEAARVIRRILANERTSFTAGRRDVQLGVAQTPAVATTIQGKIFTEDEIRAMQQADIDSATQSARAVVQEQLKRVDESMKTARDTLREQISGIKESINFFDKFKQDAVDVSNNSFAAAKEQLNASIQLAKAGAAIELIDTPELANAINTLKQDRSSFAESRKTFELEKAETAAKLKELSQVGTSKADQTIDLLTEQLGVMQRQYDVEARNLNAMLEFINFQGGVVNVSETASRLSDAELNQLASSSVKSLNQAERIQRNTTFNGSVQFPSPVGQNQSADAADSARLNQLNVFKAQVSGGQDISSDILTELKNLKKESGSTKEEVNKLFNLFNNVTSGGSAMKTVTA